MNFSIADKNLCGNVSPREEREIFKALGGSDSLKEDETVFLISSKWFLDWKEYVHFDLDRQSEASSIDRPGLISNEELVEFSKPEEDFGIISNVDIGDEVMADNKEKDSIVKLKENLLEERDYHIVKERCFQQLCHWYGLRGPSLPRKVISIGGASKILQVEVYPLVLKVYLRSAAANITGNWYDFSFSRKSSLGMMKETICTRLKLSRERFQFWNFWCDKKEFLLDNDSLILVDIGLDNEGQVILCEEIEDSAPLNEANNTTSFSEMTITSNDEKNSSSSSSSFPSTATVSQIIGHCKGLRGLMNLGNICFMNSALQCLVNVRDLRDYFLLDYHIKEINCENPLGMKGELAKAFANLTKEIWTVDSMSSVAPREIKKKIGYFAPQFVGFQQHDSQEFVAFLLDGLHEDLNRVRQKPSVELKESDGRPDEIVSEEAWQRHLLRNNSIIVDLFQGQFKSTLVCPDCERVSVTFDPMMYLSLPLPMNLEEKIGVIVASNPAVKYGLFLKMTSSIANAKNELCRIVGSNQYQSSIMATVYSGRIHKYFLEKNKLCEIRADENLFAFPIVPDKEEISDVSPIYVILPMQQCVISSQRTSNQVRYHENVKFVGFPAILRVTRTISSRRLYELVLEIVKPLIKRKPTRDDAVPESLFHLTLGNVLTDKCTKDLDSEDNTSLAIRNGQSLFLEWDIKAYRLFYDDERAQVNL